MDKSKHIPYLRDHLKELNCLGRPHSSDRTANVTVAELNNAIAHIVRLFDEIIAELENR